MKYTHGYYNTIGGLPVIQDPPKNQTQAIVFGNETVSFHCNADGEGLSYSWHRQDLELPYSATGNTTNTLVISEVREEDSGNYQCIVSNKFGMVASDYASLRVTGIIYMTVTIVILNVANYRAKAIHILQ